MLFSSPPRASKVLLVAALSLVGATGHADDLVRPRLLGTTDAPWPVGASASSDVVVPVTLVVAEDGSVIEVVVDDSPGPLWTSAAKDAVVQWRFEPALHHGNPVSARIRSLVQFRRPRVKGPFELPSSDGSAAVAPSPVQVTVAGRRPARSASETARDRSQLSAAPHKSASEMMLSLPGLFLTQHGGEGKAHQVFLRGFDAVHGQDLELRAAGLPVNDVSNVHGQGYADLNFLIPESVHEITLRPGPFDPRQGDFAVAGSVDFRLGLERPGALLKHSIGSFGSQRTVLGVRPEQGSADTFLLFSHASSDGFGPSRASQSDSALAQASHSLDSNTHVRWFGSAYAARFDSPGVLPLAWINDRKVSRTAVWIPDQGGQSSRTSVSAELTHDQERSSLALRLFLIQRSLGLRQNFTGWLDNPVQGDTSYQRNDAQTLGLEASAARQLRLVSERDRIEIGLSARNDAIEQSQRRIAQTDGHELATLVDATVRATRLGGYVDASLFPLKGLVVRGGLRLEGMSFLVDDRSEGEGTSSRSAQGAVLAKRIVGDYAIVHGLHAVASYGEGFRSPQARSLGDGERAPFTTVSSYEAGVRYTDPRLTIQGAVFQSLLSRDLVFDHATGRNEETPGTVRTGVSLDLVVKPTGNLQSTASLTLVRARFRETSGTYESGASLPYVPQVVARSDSSYESEVASVFGRPLRTHVGLGLTLLAQRKLPYDESGHPIFLTDAKLAARWSALELSVDCYNVFDAKWFDGEFVYASSPGQGQAGSLVPQRHVTVGAPRSFWGAATLTW